MTIQLGPLQLGTIPRIAGIIERPLTASELADVRQAGVTILEFRADRFPGGVDALREYFKSVDLRGFARLGTIRVDFAADTPLHPETPAPFTSRAAAFESLFPWLDAIDVEVESPERPELIQLARCSNRLVVLSSHDFTKTPAPSRLEEIVAEAERLQADIVKLAVFAHSAEELQRVLTFTAECRFPNRVTIAMGEYGLLSRVAAPFFGSLISYGFIDQPNAPGQLSAADLHTEFLRFHPAYRADFEARARAT